MVEYWQKPNFMIGVMENLDGVVGLTDEVFVLPEGDLREVLMRACAERGVFCFEREHWVEEMMNLLQAADVETPRDFLEGQWCINARFATYGYGEITSSAIKMITRLCCDSLFEAGERAGRAAAMHAVRNSAMTNSLSPAAEEVVAAGDDMASLESGEVAFVDGRVDNGGGRMIDDDNGRMVDGAWEPSYARIQTMRGPFTVLDTSDDDLN